jgi:hypothetical protein
MFQASLENSIYNLSSIEYVKLIHNSSTIGGQTSDFSVWLANVSTPIGNYVDSNSGIEMTNGFMRWNTRQYGISIQNEYNDLQTRTLTYTGGLYTASDSNLKYDTSYADVGEIHEAVKKLPLRRYGLSDKYKTIFRTKDAHQLGVLTTEVAKQFPAFIHKVESEHLAVTDLQTVDRIQMRYAHLGATQHLMNRISTLTGKIHAFTSTSSLSLFHPGL